MAIIHQIRKYPTKRHEIVDKLRRQSGAEPPKGLRIMAQEQAEALAETMSLLHGGEWRVQIDHESQIALVARMRRPRNPL